MTSKEIIATNGRSILIDSVDFVLLSQYNWNVVKIHRKNYARKTSGYNGESGKYMHQLILYAPKGLEIDHINGDGLDNRRENLRLASHAQNIVNADFNQNMFGYRGVYKNRKRYGAQTKVNGKKVHIGTYDTPEEAHQAYLNYMIKKWGEFVPKSLTDKINDL